ncbi:hypothetical protein Vca1114GL_03510 [Vibrio campbellii]|uniref:hypothetical protein n=1 Tax=Vibrio campbellii TaxID=680 RepID=UPI00097FAA31|nr:hypothetical protein [Vibrio campbellii]AQM69936.1 hypothetical protein Vca1114GL_03510 [Vibrio campbellii]
MKEKKQYISSHLNSLPGINGFLYSDRDKLSNKDQAFIKNDNASMSHVIQKMNINDYRAQLIKLYLLEEAMIAFRKHASLIRFGAGKLVKYIINGIVCSLIDKYPQLGLFKNEMISLNDWIVGEVSKATTKDELKSAFEKMYDYQGSELEKIISLGFDETTLMDANGIAAFKSLEEVYQEREYKKPKTSWWNIFWSGWGAYKGYLATDNMITDIKNGNFGSAYNDLKEVISNITDSEWEKRLSILIERFSLDVKTGMIGVNKIPESSYKINQKNTKIRTLNRQDLFFK